MPVAHRTLVAAIAGLLLALPSLAGAALVSQGVFRMGADAYWSRGITGAGETVAIVDLAFSGLDASIAAGELPPRDRLMMRSFDAEFGFEGRSAVGGVSEHGVRMAEIVHDIAPDAQLVLVNYHTLAEFVQAVDWLIANQIPVVSHSNSFLTSPHAGTGPAARAVDRAASAGVLWVNSAGNYARRHTSGIVGPAGLEIPITPREGEVLQFSAGSRGPAPVDLFVQKLSSAGWATVVTGGPDPEAEPRLDGVSTVLTPVTVVDGGEWRILIRATSPVATEFELFSRSVGFGAAVRADSSVMTPADAGGAVAVGAVPWTGLRLASYSSQGPTDDGRVKPDIVAPTYITSNPAWPGTAGTSAATPHVAAGAALLRQEAFVAGRPRGPADIRAELARRALDLGARGPDMLYGVGMVRLDVVRPRARVRVRHGRRPTVRVTVRDNATVEGVRVRVNGRQVASRRGPRASLRLPAIGRRGARVEVIVSDLAGNSLRRTLRIRGPR